MFLWHFLCIEPVAPWVICGGRYWSTEYRNRQLLRIYAGAIYFIIASIIVMNITRVLSIIHRVSFSQFIICIPKTFIALFVTLCESACSMKETHTHTQGAASFWHCKTTIDFVRLDQLPLRLEVDVYKSWLTFSSGYFGSPRRSIFKWFWQRIPALILMSTEAKNSQCTLKIRIGCVIHWYVRILVPPREVVKK